MWLFDLITKPLVDIKARKIALHVKGYAKGKMLDLGAGRCLIAQEIKRRYKVKPTCVDVLDVNKTDLKLIIYDGVHLPFGKNQFNSVLIAYVLHHCDQPMKVLKEGVRVCKGNIIIFEDTKMNPIEEMLDSVVNKMNKVNTPHNFKTEEQWIKTFKSLGLKLVYKENNVEKEWFYPFVEHTMFVLKK
jgi:SAM-dependent methyltransferase